MNDGDQQNNGITIRDIELDVNPRIENDFGVREEERQIEIIKNNMYDGEDFTLNTTSR